MTKPLVILDSDSASRQALEGLLQREGLAEVCSVLSPEKAGKDAAAYIWLGGRDEPIPKGFEIGDYDRFLKPVRAGDLIERVQAYDAKSRGEPKEIEIGPFKLDLFSHEISRDGEVIRLTEKESRILMLLSKNNGEVMNRDNLLQAVWGYADGIETHTLETHIYRLRRKIERDPSKPEILITVEAGYKLRV